MKAPLNPKAFLREKAARLKRIRAAPRAVAGGVAIGIFWGFTPLTGLKTLLSLLFAWMTRCSKIAAVIAVTLHDILTPIWPVILRWEYDVGFWILSNPHRFPEKFHVADAHLRAWLHFSTLKIVWPMFVGSLVFAIPAALICYWIVREPLERYERTHPHLSRPE